MPAQQSFSEYLRSKKIDEVAFQKEYAGKYAELKALFEQMHPESFTNQKKFILNDLRRRFLLKEKTE
ncbi:MAG: hypothetical protein NZ551_04695 [Microscillaceae bacterium]|nr:hypothetical protein [Microscillaceae bacterium]MDW8460491.1 hypothetical protein [Cytophagales bacterium]